MIMNPMRMQTEMFIMLRWITDFFRSVPFPRYEPNVIIMPIASENMKNTSPTAPRRVLAVMSPSSGTR